MNNLKEVMHLDSVQLSMDEKSVIIIDQTKLPNALEYLTLGTEKELNTAICDLKIQGALAIGIYAAYGMYVLAQKIEAEDFDNFYDEYKKYTKNFNLARPTAVYLSYVLIRMDAIVSLNKDKTKNEIIMLLGKESKAIHSEVLKICESISENGLSLLKDGDGILTHCNSGPLSSTGYGTALGPLFLGKERGMKFKVFANETRPLLQGARLTSYELEKAGIDVILLCDNMTSIVMKNGWVSSCFVGGDRIAANGDTASKIGTSGIAILAKHYGIPFYVLCPAATIDLNCKTGDDIVIEMRDPNEIKEKFYKEPMTLREVKCYNPAFDVTDNSLITGIITEKGICYPPFDQSFGNIK